MVEIPTFFFKTAIELSKEQTKQMAFFSVVSFFKLTSSPYIQNKIHSAAIGDAIYKREKIAYITQVKRQIETSENHF